MANPSRPGRDRPVYLAVDGGGTKTLAVLVDAQGRELGRGLAESSNHRAVGLQTAAARLHAACSLAARAAGRDLPVTAAWLGLAGIDRPGDVDLLRSRLAAVAGELRLTNDAELVLAGLDGRAGVALVAGTGSIALGRDAGGHIVRVGGWGHLIGDEGSGYDIGRRALQAAMRMADGRAPRTALLDRVLAHYGAAAREDLLEHVYSRDKAALAALAGDVLEASREGDAAARRIVRTAARELAHVALAAARSAGPADEPLALALGGGLLVIDAGYRRMVVGRIRRARSLGRVALVAEPALAAAQSLAQSLAVTLKGEPA